MSQDAASRVDGLYGKLDREAEASGYRLNPDREFTRELVEGLLANGDRYGYQACPCRLASGEKADDLDIVCPCDYRDADLEEYGACYCALYVSQEIKDGEAEAKPIPERRPPSRDERDGAKGERASAAEGAPAGGTFDGLSAAVLAESKGGGKLAYPVWRCSVCGYLCARDEPPGVCPVCKAKKERFERFV